MNYTLHQLQVFIEVVRAKSITRAAEVLHMTQPAVSIQLKNFQEQFAIPLTEIVGRQLFVTAFGEEIAQAAHKVIEQTEVINYKTMAYKGKLTGKLNIASASTGKYVIPYFLTGFLDSHPGIDLRLDVANKAKVVESLKKNLVDFALVSVLPDHINVEEEVLIENRLYLMGNQPKMLKDKPLVFGEKGSATRRAMESYFVSTKGKQRKRIELTSNEAVKQAVIAGLGQSIIPLIGTQDELLNQHIYIWPAQGLPIKTNWRLIWLKGKRLLPAALAFLDFVKAQKKTILKNHFEWYLSYE